MTAPDETEGVTEVSWEEARGWLLGHIVGVPRVHVDSLAVLLDRIRREAREQGRREAFEAVRAVQFYGGMTVTKWAVEEAQASLAKGSGR